MAMDSRSVPAALHLDEARYESYQIHVTLSHIFLLIPYPVVLLNNRYRVKYTLNFFLQARLNLLECCWQHDAAADALPQSNVLPDRATIPMADYFARLTSCRVLGPPHHLPPCQL